MTTEIQQQAPGGSIMIATPMYGGMCTAHYMAGVMGAVGELGQNGFSVYFANTINESLITRARNELARQFLSQPFDYLMFVDADIAFEGSAIVELVRADKDIVCGLYPKKEIAWNQVRDAALRGEPDLRCSAGAFAANLPLGQDSAVIDRDGLIEIQHGGTGFMLIKRRVFETLATAVPEYRVSAARDAEGRYLHPVTKEFFATSIDRETNVLLSEDYHFCQLWRQQGGRIYARPSIRLEHVGTYVYGGVVKF